MLLRTGLSSPLLIVVNLPRPGSVRSPLQLCSRLPRRPRGWGSAPYLGRRPVGGRLAASAPPAARRCRPPPRGPTRHPSILLCVPARPLSHSLSLPLSSPAQPVTSCTAAHSHTLATPSVALRGCGLEPPGCPPTCLRRPQPLGTPPPTSDHVAVVVVPEEFADFARLG